MCKSALYKSIVFNECSIIATSNLTLVEQLYNEVNDIYENSDLDENDGLNKRKMKDTIINVVGHTSVSPLDDKTLFLLFIKGRTLFVPVHNYFNLFDLMGTSSHLYINLALIRKLRTRFTFDTNIIKRFSRSLCRIYGKKEFSFCR